jgi:hypothetical protein
MRTTSAIEKRRAIYLQKDNGNLSHIQKARAAGAKNARQIADALNSEGVPGPTSPVWTESAVLRCLRRLKALELDCGSLPAHKARDRKYRHLVLSTLKGFRK